MGIEILVVTNLGFHVYGSTGVLKVLRALTKLCTGFAQVEVEPWLQLDVPNWQLEQGLGGIVY